jgi:hypothetical protein
MNTLDKVTINNKIYYDAENVKKQDTAYFYGCSRTRNIVEKKKLQQQDYIYGTLKDNQWIVANPDYKKAKLLLTQKWIINNVPKLKGLLERTLDVQNIFRLSKEKSKEESSCTIIKKNNLDSKSEISYTEASPIIILNDEEKFKDINGNSIDIEVRGEREYNKCYFKVKDVSKGFNMMKLSDILTDKNTNYEKDLHYKFFICSNPNTIGVHAIKTLFLTYNGMLKVLFSSRTGNAESFQNWATKRLFTIQMGTNEMKQTLCSKLLGVSTDAVKQVLKKSVISISCVYFFSLGTVKQLRNSFNISNNYDDDMIVIKYGRTDNLERRTTEHEKDYGNIENVDLRLMKYAFIDDKYTSEAEVDLSNFFNYSKYKYDFPNRNELAIIPKDKINIVEKEYEKIRKIYAGNLKEIINEKEKLLNEIIKLKLIHKIELNEEKHKHELNEEKHKHELNEEKHKNEILQMKLIIAEMKNK